MQSIHRSNREYGHEGGSGKKEERSVDCALDEIHPLGQTKCVVMLQTGPEFPSLDCSTAKDLTHCSWYGATAERDPPGQSGTACYFGI